jgi:hypothetical protein
MGIDWTDFITAVGLAFVLEGLFYFIGADRMPPVLRMLSERPPSDLRKMGLAALLLGILVVALARSL